MSTRAMRRPPTPLCELHPDGRTFWLYVWNGATGDFVKARVGLEMLDRAEAHRWRIDSNGYPITTVYDVVAKKATRLGLHRMVTNAPAGVIVDHRYGNKLDARRCMLRFATFSQNSANRRGARRKKLSKYRGVTLHRQTGRWQAQAKFQDRFIHGGLHDTQESAALAYNAIAKRTWGRFAVLNRVRKARLPEKAPR